MTRAAATVVALVVLALAAACQASPNTGAATNDASPRGSATSAGTPSATHRASATTTPTASPSPDSTGSASPVEQCLEAAVKDTWHNIGTETADAPARSAAADALEDLELEGRQDELRDDLVAALRSSPLDENALALAAVAWEGNVGLPTC